MQDSEITASELPEPEIDVSELRLIIRFIENFYSGRFMEQNIRGYVMILKIRCSENLNGSILGYRIKNKFYNAYDMLKRIYDENQQ